LAYEFHQKGMGFVLLGSDQYCACHKDMDTEQDDALGTMSAGQQQLPFSKLQLAAHAANPS